MRVRRISWLILVALLGMQWTILLLVLREPSHLVGDEGYYVAKARHLARTGRLARASATHMAIERGREWGQTDFRPPGYPVLVAAIGDDLSDETRLRLRIAAVQFGAMAVTLIVAHWLMAPNLCSRWQQILLAAVLGIAPWPLEGVSSIYPDTFVAAGTFLGVVVLWHAKRRVSTAWLFAGSLVVSTTLLIRPEMILFALLLITATALLPPRQNHLAVAIAFGFLLPVAVQYAYRVYFTQTLVTRLFPTLRAPYAGAFDWTSTWVGTEHERYDGIVYAVENGTPPVIPERAILNEAERVQLTHVTELIHHHGRYLPEADAIFARLAESRRGAMPFRAILLPKAARMLQLWINTNTNNQLLVLLKPVPRPFRRALLAALMALKVLLLGLFLVTTFRVIRRPRVRDPLWQILALLVGFVVIRTFVMGAVFDTLQHRYVLVAWVPVLCCAAAVFTGDASPPRNADISAASAIER